MEVFLQEKTKKMNKKKEKSVKEKAEKKQNVE